MTIFFSSHVLEVVERLCEKVAILDRGRLRAAGSVDAIRSEHGFTPGTPLEDMFVDLVGGTTARGELAWMR